MTDRRPLRFDTLDQALTEVDRLAAADVAGTLATTGRWTFGQALNHIATWVDYSYDGVPLRLPLPFRLVMRLVKKQVLHAPMRPASRLPRTPNGTLATEVVPSNAGLDHIRRAFARLREEPATQPHPAFGTMTYSEWTALHLRHAELHLSFFRTT
jgi:hypothetical protein